MPRYKVLEKSLIGNEIHEAGAEVEYDGLPSANLEPICDEGRMKAMELEEINKARVETMISQNPPAAGLDPASFAKALAEAISPLIAAIGEKNAVVEPEKDGADSALVGKKSKAE